MSLLKIRFQTLPRSQRSRVRKWREREGGRRRLSLPVSREKRDSVTLTRMYLSSISVSRSEVSSSLSSSSSAADIRLALVFCCQSENVRFDVAITSHCRQHVCNTEGTTCIAEREQWRKVHDRREGWTNTYIYMFFCFCYAQSTAKGRIKAKQTFLARVIQKQAGKRFNCISE